MVSRKPYLRFALGILLTQWPVPLCVWWMVHMVGWRAAVLIYALTLVAVGLFLVGLGLLGEEDRDDR